MIVRTLERRFAVLRVLCSNQNREIYVCQDLEEEGARLCTLARFRDPALNCQLLPMLARQQDNPAFEDYLGLFTQDGDLYARFRYSEAPTLAQRLERGDLGLRERLEIGGNLLERMALLNMPAPLQFEALQEGNVTVDAALQVRFNYVLGSMAAFFNVNMDFVCLQTWELLHALFASELSARAVPELEAYLRQLKGSSFKTYLEMYTGYDRVRKKLLERSLDRPVEPATWLFRLWNRIKKLSWFVRPVLAGLVLVAALCYLLYTLLLPPQPKGTPVFFNHIGTVEIQGADTKKS